MDIRKFFKEHMIDNLNLLVFEYDINSSVCESKGFGHIKDDDFEERFIDLLINHIVFYSFEEDELINEYNRNRLDDLRKAAVAAYNKRIPKTERKNDGLLGELVLDMVLKSYYPIEMLYARIKYIDQVPTKDYKKLTCPKCGSNDIQVNLLSHNVSENRSCLWNALMIIMTGGIWFIWMLVRKRKESIKVNKQAVCQKCGFNGNLDRFKNRNFSLNKKVKNLTKKQKIVISIVAIIFIIIAIPLSQVVSDSDISSNDIDNTINENEETDNTIEENQEIITYLNDKWTDDNIEITVIDVKIDKWLYSQYSDLQEGYNDNRKHVCFKIEVKNLTNEKISFGVHSCDYKLTYTSGDDNNALSIFECTDAYGRRIEGWMPIRSSSNTDTYYDNVIGVSIDTALIYDSCIEPNETRMFMNAFVTEEKSLEDAMHSINISKVSKRGWVFTYYDHLGKIILQN
jgi:predicted RNA-binding Zn-ribbon protein involved in translation (DUF1610 family)